MGICRDTYGRLSYTATNGSKSVFSVEKKYGPPYTIYSHQPYYTTDAVYSDPDFLWIDLPKFDSFIQAVRFLKENLEQLR